MLTRLRPFVLLVGSVFVFDSGARAESDVIFSGQKRLNNLVTELLEVAKISRPSGTFKFKRLHPGYIFVTADCRGKGTAILKLDEVPQPLAVFKQDADAPQPPRRSENFRGRAQPDRAMWRGHRDQEISRQGDSRADALRLGVRPGHQILRQIRPSLSQARYLAERHDVDRPAGAAPRSGSLSTNGTAREKSSSPQCGSIPRRKRRTNTSESGPASSSRLRIWTASSSTSSSSTGRYREWVEHMTPQRKQRFDEESARHPIYEEAFRKIRADRRYRDKMVYAYIGGSGKKLNQEIIGPTFIHSILDCDYRVGLERYIFEVSSRAKIQRRPATVRRRDCRLGGQGADSSRTDGADLRAILDAAWRNQQAAERRLSRLDGPTDERSSPIIP